jgi:hypothetical protein
MDRSWYNMSEARGEQAKKSELNDTREPTPFKKETSLPRQM